MTLIDIEKYEIESQTNISQQLIVKMINVCENLQNVDKVDVEWLVLVCHEKYLRHVAFVNHRHSLTGVWKKWMKLSKVFMWSSY